MSGVQLTRSRCVALSVPALAAEHHQLLPPSQTRLTTVGRPRLSVRPPAVPPSAVSALAVPYKFLLWLIQADAILHHWIQQADAAPACHFWCNGCRLAQQRTAHGGALGWCRQCLPARGCPSGCAARRRGRSSMHRPGPAAAGRVASVAATGTAAMLPSGTAWGSSRRHAGTGRWQCCNMLAHGGAGHQPPAAASSLLFDCQRVRPDIRQHNGCWGAAVITAATIAATTSSVAPVIVAGWGWPGRWVRACSFGRIGRRAVSPEPQGLAAVAVGWQGHAPLRRHPPSPQASAPPTCRVKGRGETV